MIQGNSVRKPFGHLQPYTMRILICRKQPGLQSTLEYIQKAHGIDGRIVLHDEILTFGEREIKFKFFTLNPDQSANPTDKDLRIYTFLAQTKKMGIIIGRNIYNLLSFKKAPVITYIHPYAISFLNKISSLSNFLPILFHSPDELETYFNSGKFLFNDEIEVLYYLQQKQSYVMERIMSRVEYREKTQAKREKYDNDRSEKNGGRRDNDNRNGGRKGKGRQNSARRNQVPQQNAWEKPLFNQIPNNSPMNAMPQQNPLLNDPQLLATLVGVIHQQQFQLNSQK